MPLSPPAPFLSLSLQFFSSSEIDSSSSLTNRLYDVIHALHPADRLDSIIISSTST